MSRNPHFQNLICKDKYRRLKPSLSESEHQALKSDIMRNGCREPIMAWKHMILDGYKRYEICRNWDLPYVTRHVYFQSRDDAIAYICADQLKRNDLSKEAVSYLIGKQFEAQKNINSRLSPA